MEWLKEILPDAGRVVTDGIEERYLSDTLGRLRGRAAALVFVESTEEVSGILREAHRRGVPVTPRGAGRISSAPPCRRTAASSLISPV